MSKEIVQAFKNTRDRIHALETQQPTYPQPIERFPYADTQLGTVSGIGSALSGDIGAVLEGAFLIVEPGLYLVTGYFDFEAGNSGGGLTDEAFYAVGQLMVNSVVMPTDARMRLLSVAGSDAVRRGIRAVVAQSWAVGVFDNRQIMLLDSPTLLYPLDDYSANTSVFNSYTRDISALLLPSTTQTTNLVKRQPGLVTNKNIDGLNNYSTYFNGAAGITGNVSSVPSASAGTLEAWFKTNNTAKQFLIGNENIATNRNGVSIYMDAAGHVVGEVASGAASQSIQSAATYIDNATHHVVFSYDGTNLNLYVDGVLVTGPTAQTVTPVSVAALRVGFDTSGGNFFTGYIAVPAMYATALPADRVLYHYVAGATTILPAATYKVVVLADSPLFFFRLDDISGTVMLDTSPHLLNGTYTSSGVVLNQPGATLVESDGTYNSSASFGGYGSGGSGQVSDAGLVSGSGARSCEAYIYLTATPAAVPSQQSTVFAYGTLNVAGQGWALTVTNNLKLRFFNGSVNTDGTTVLKLRTWYHVVCVTNGSSVTVYLNSNVEITGTPAIATVLTGTFYIGDQGGIANRYFQGLIDDVSYYAAALSAAQVKAHYLAGRSNRAWLQLGAYKTGGTDLSYARVAGTKLVVEKLTAVARS